MNTPPSESDDDHDSPPQFHNGPWDAMDPWIPQEVETDWRPPPRPRNNVIRPANEPKRRCNITIKGSVNTNSNQVQLDMTFDLQPDGTIDDGDDSDAGPSTLWDEELGDDKEWANLRTRYYPDDILYEEFGEADRTSFFQNAWEAMHHPYSGESEAPKEEHAAESERDS